MSAALTAAMPSARTIFDFAKGISRSLEREDTAVVIDPLGLTVGKEQIKFQEKIRDAKNNAGEILLTLGLP
ncbi:hypothetical protein RsS62_41240 [Rhizobium dioscoreae]|nr:hypothetical protein RsS62_41240 [Rhizobium dioscoreae]